MSYVLRSAAPAISSRRIQPHPHHPFSGPAPRLIRAAGGGLRPIPRGIEIGEGQSGKIVQSLNFVLWIVCQVFIADEQSILPQAGIGKRRIVTPHAQRQALHVALERDGSCLFLPIEFFPNLKHGSDDISRIAHHHGELGFCRELPKIAEQGRHFRVF